MNTRPFAQPIWFLSLCNAASVSLYAVRSLVSSSVVGLRLRRQAAIERRKQRRFAEELREMSDHMLRDIGVGHSAIDWVVHRDP